MNSVAPYLIVGVTAGAIALALIPFALLIAVLAAAKETDVELGYDEASVPQPASIDRALVHYQTAYAEALKESPRGSCRSTPSGSSRVLDGHACR